MKIDDRNVYMPARYTVTVAGISRRKHKLPSTKHKTRPPFGKDYGMQASLQSHMGTRCTRLTISHRLLPEK